MIQLLQNRDNFSSVGKSKKFHLLNVIGKRKNTIKVFLTMLLIGVSFATQAQCPTAPGNQTTYGSNSWIGYVYSSINASNPPTNAFTTTYRGYVTQPEIFDQNINTGSLSGANLCGTYSNNFSIRFKMTKNFPAGYYKFTVGGGDGFRLSLDGGNTFILGDFTDHGYYTINSSSLFLSGNANLVLEYYERSGSSRVSFDYTYCAGYSTAPTSITGTTTICNGNSTTLTATGGTAATGVVYEWGTGSTVGFNTIVGQTNASITVNPTSNKTYWVRRVDTNACNNTTAGVTQLITVVNTSTAPTSITGTTNICQGSSTTLSANGGTSATGAVYEWGIGSVVGSNTIAGQSNSSITVTPTTTTTYWVRRVDIAPCSNGTAGVTTTVTVNPVAGDETTYGTNSWIGYVYSPIDTSNPPVNAYSTNYRGYITQPEIFDQNIGNGSISGVNLCGTYSNNFSIRFKMERNFPAGYYTFNIGGGDGYRLSLDGGATFIVNNYSDHGYLTSTSAQYYLSGITDLVLEYYERSGSSRVSFNYTVCTVSTAPTAISGTTSLCSTAGGTTLTATGGVLATGATYQWGTGNTIGNNVIFGANSASYYINPGSTTTYWVRINDNTCGTYTSGVTQTITVATQSTQVVSINGSLNICSGGSTTLVASGGTLGTGAVYQWGTGYSAGVNIIAGATTNSITVSPTSTTGYWVRRMDPAPCNTNTGHITTTVNVSASSTPPTAISGASTPTCVGNTTTLTATGGSLIFGSSYQWGTGSVIGSNVIAGQTSSSISVNPASTTTYWVRIHDTSCGLYTSGVTATLTVGAPNGDETTYGTNSWIGYVYYPIDVANPPANPYTSNYRGYITQPEIFDQNIGNGSISGANLCGTYSNNFSIRFKMERNFPAGYYTFTVGGGDGYRLSLDGGATFVVGNYSDHTYLTSTTAQYYLSGITDLVLEYYERSGSSRVSFNYVSCTTTSTAPTSISGSTSLCATAGGTTLTATGGVAAPGATYQWGTGSTVGNNIIFGATSASYYINPASTTTYWVRRVDGAPCNLTTAGVTQTITVATQSTQVVSINGSLNICSGGSTTLVASGGTLGTGAVYQWGTGYSAGVNIIAGATTNSITVSPTSTTGYWVRRVDPAPCNTSTGHITTTVTVSPSSTAPTAISGAGAPACAGNTTTLTATGGALIAGSSYQWGTGSVIGSNFIAGQTSASMSVSPASTTSYWVRIHDTSCGSYTNGVTTTVSIISVPGNPSVAGSNVWNVYGYSTGDITLATAVYAGYYTANTLNFDTQSGTNSWLNNASPSSSAGWSGCTVPNDNFTMVAKRLGFPCGTYSIAMQNWDDAAQLYLNGTLIWSNGTWSGTGNNNVAVGSYALDATSELELRIRENSGNANVSITLTNTNVASTAPTSITGSTTICGTGSTTLTATGGTTGTSGTYEWGTGTVGTNTIAGQTSASITVSPTSNTTYWVRRVDTVCNNTTSGVSQVVTVYAATVAGTLSSAATTICRYTTPSPIVLSGNVGNVIKWQYANDLAFTSGVTNIASTATTLTSALIGSLTTTRYFRAVVQSGTCSTLNTNPITITVPATVTFNGSWNGTPSATTPVVISGNLTLASNLNVCSCQVTSTAVVTVPANVTLIVQKDITVATTANIIVEDLGSLIQVDDNAADIGNVTFKRKTTPLKQYDFTYWSSPLVAQPLSSLAAPSLFYSFNPNINNWSYELPTTTMTPAKGYISRAPNNLNYATPQITQVAFNGVPNNGVINAPIVKSTGVTYNLIGNPYPSAIDIDTFLQDPANINVVNGTIYLWTHNTAISNSIPGNTAYNYTRDDYAKYNITGGVKTASASLSGGVTPNGKVAAGQGFFIESNAALANGNYQATFNNSMRVAGNNDQFFKIKSIVSASTVDVNNTNLREKNRVWLNVTNDGGAYDETLVGYITDATDGLDNLFDGKTLLGSNVVSLYSILGTTNLAIQGKALPFNDADVVPLGFTTTITGDFKIGLENFDGIFSDKNIYLLDKTTNTSYDLKAQSYSFNIPTSGTFDNRFELHFSGSTSLANNDFNYNENNLEIIKKDKHIDVKSTNETIKSIEVFDLLGKTVYTKSKLDCSEFITTDFNIAPQVLVVKVALNNNQIITKKVVMN